MYRAAPLGCLSSMMLTLFCMNLLHSSLFFMFPFTSLRPRAINQGLGRALSSHSSASLLHLFTFWLGLAYIRMLRGNFNFL